MAASTKISKENLGGQVVCEVRGPVKGTPEGDA
jgi:hypothetical protein